MKTISRTIIAAIFITFGAGQLHAQGATAAISGTVLDPSGAAIAGASISVRNIGTAFTRTVLSNDQGRYVAPELPIGEYEVQEIGRASCRERVEIWVSAGSYKKK